MESIRQAVRQVHGILKVAKHSATPNFAAWTRNASNTYYKGALNTFSRQATEVKIPAPWGHMAGVWWGPQDRQPILALHGWQDNAYTWRPLMELLPPDVSVLGIDFPGHGFSSHYPNGTFYHSPDNLINMRRVVKHFGWNSVSLLGHSMGAIASFSYAACYPEETNFLILLDNIKPITTRKKNIFTTIGGIVDKLLVIEDRHVKNSMPPAYKEDDLIELVHLALNTSIDRDASRILLERGAAQSPSDPTKYYYTRDARLKYGMTLGLSDEDVRIMALRLTMPILTAKFDRGSYFEPKEKYDEIVNLLKSYNKEFEFHTVKGTHHAHLNDPTELAPLVNAFLQKHHK